MSNNCGCKSVPTTKECRLDNSKRNTSVNTSVEQEILGLKHLTKDCESPISCCTNSVCSDPAYFNLYISFVLWYCKYSNQTPPTLTGNPIQDLFSFLTNFGKYAEIIGSQFDGSTKTVNNNLQEEALSFNKFLDYYNANQYTCDYKSIESYIFCSDERINMGISNNVENRLKTNAATSSIENQLNSIRN
jgi:hypothetical protein